MQKRITLKRRMGQYVLPKRSSPDNYRCIHAKLILSKTIGPKTKGMAVRY